MSETKITLLPQGLRDNELHLLKAICILSDGRGRGYSFTCSPQPGSQSAAIWIVDASAEAAWRAQHGHTGARAVMVVPAGTATDGEHVVRRPMTPSRLLAALDAISEGEMGFLEHVVIGGAGGGDSAPAPTRRETTTHVRHMALVVDDSTTIQRQIETSLRAMGIGAVCVDNGGAALKALEESEFDIIFLDVILEGDADGYQICKSIRRHGAHRRTPVVMLTSKSSTFDRVRGSMAGCDTYLTKPVDAGTFKEVVEKYLPDAVMAAPQFT